MMFNKKQCSGCGKNIKKDYDFCPFCGEESSGKMEDFGMLGKNDIQNDFEDMSQNIFGGFGNGILNKMLNHTMKILEKELQKEMKSNQMKPKTNMQLFINGKKVDLNTMQPQKNPVKKKQKIKSIHFSEKNQEKFAFLKQKEPKTSIKRLGDTVIYEIFLPNVKSLKNISIIKLENSVEVKAISRSIAYFKTISINLNLIGYGFNNGKLKLEFESD